MPRTAYGCIFWKKPHKPSHLHAKDLRHPKALTEQTWVLPCNAARADLFAVQAAGRAGLRGAAELPRTGISTARSPSPASRSSAPGLRPDPLPLLHPAPSRFLHLCLGSKQQKPFSKPACSENTAFLRATEESPARGLPPVKAGQVPAAPAASASTSPWLSPPAAIQKSPGRKRICQPVPAQQVRSPVPRCYCSHATPRRHLGARPETITISYNNVRAAPEPGRCRKHPVPSFYE